MLPWTALTIAVTPLAGLLADRLGNRPLIASGLVLQRSGSPGWPYWPHPARITPSGGERQHSPSAFARAVRVVRRLVDLDGDAVRELARRGRACTRRRARRRRGPRARRAAHQEQIAARLAPERSDLLHENGPAENGGVPHFGVRRVAAAGVRSCCGNRLPSTERISRRRFDRRRARRPLRRSRRRSVASPRSSVIRT
jgi:hypothetical protein